MATRSNASASSKFAAKATVIDNGTQRVDGEATMGSFFESLGLPTYKRAIVAFISGVLVSGTSMYLGTYLTMYLAVGAAMFTGSMFILFITMFLGYAISILASLIIGGKVQAFILDGSIDRVCIQATAKVGGWLNNAKSFMSSTVSSVTSKVTS